MRGSFNAQPWGPVHDQQVQGVNKGISTRVSLISFERSETPSGLYLQENDITTLFFSGVNAHQCVFGTMIDAYFKQPLVVVPSPVFLF
ncbi:hypothetical protein JB92DRAFT_3197730 [Gautieria morchelliformis]|nr:hypothetical protein JB92DRAFT_3197730 [Gautieria morchelliformis]